MKKILSIIMIIAVLLSCCACGGKKEEANPLEFPNYEEALQLKEDQENAGKATPEEMYGMIDQTVPVDGVYKIWNAEGVKLMAEHPEASFEILCNVDMEGAALQPIGTKDKPFTGEINGQNNTIKNFTVNASDDGYLGFIGYNEGKIHDIILDEVTLVSKDTTKYMGGVAGYSTTDIKATTINGSLDASSAADNAFCGSFVGATTAGVVNSVADVDINYAAAGAATVGGIAGSCENGNMEFTESYGDLVISGSNKKAGLFLGEGKAVTIYTIAFLGEKNTVDDKLLETPFGAEEEVTYEELLIRDNTARPLPENVQKLRDTVEQRMRDMGTVEWSTSENLYHDCVCNLAVCYGSYMPGVLHRGIPYNHKGGSMARFMYCMEPIGNDHYIAADWTYDIKSYDGFDLYIGNDCSGAVQNAWWSVSNSSDVLSCQYMQTGWNRGTIAVGDWPSDTIVPDGKDTAEVICEAAGTEVMYDAYAQMRKGDAIVHIGEEGNHTRLVASDAVIVRNEKGQINGNYSYILSHEQGAPAVLTPYFCSWRIDFKYTFSNLFMSGYLPVTIEELITGEMEPAECEMTGNPGGYTGLFTGEVKANYHLECVTLKITDSKGETAFEHTLWCAADREADFSSRDNGIRNYHTTYDLANFAVPLQYAQFKKGETYNYDISAYLAIDETFELGGGSFTYGSAA